MRLLSEEKKAETIGFLLPENVKGRKSGSLCNEISLRVRSSLHVRMNLESLDQVTPLIFCEWRLPYFLYRTRGENILWSIAGLSNILHFVPVATKKNLPSGLNSRAVTGSLKLKCAMTTRLAMLMKRAKPSLSTVSRVLPSGDKTIREMLLLF